MSSSGRKRKTKYKVDLAVIGGSGLESLDGAEIVDRVDVETRFGHPSDMVTIARHGGGSFAFLPRHGSEHEFPPHRIPYRANIAALKELGVKTVIATCIAGSLKRDIPPGAFVIPDQFVNMTWGRDDCGPGGFTHLAMAEPYCARLRAILRKSALKSGKKVRPSGTTVVIQGPRFSTIAESRFFAKNGWDIVNMTQYPECYFAREAGLCYAVLASVTDWDVGVPSSLSMRPENMNRVLAIFWRNVAMTKTIVLDTIASMGAFDCGCSSKVSQPYYETE